GHLNGGARLVIITAPPKDESIPMIVIGVNHTQFQPGQDGLDIVSNASCTTNCLAPVCHVLDSVFGIEQGVMTTVHSFTNDQRLVDNPHKDLRRARSAHQAIIPTTTGAARSLGRILPRLAGRLDGYALRVPTPDVSIANLTVALSRPATVAEVNEVFRRASEGSLRGILGYTEEPLVSADFIGDQRSAVVDGSLTYVLPGGLVHVAAWYDNEWAYACRTLDLAAYLGAGVGVATRAVSE
ncbi:MAG: type I glyceraldehyde-3-phosphate dehydrogenase, partial [Clostridia bacterium]|nr:type I glyceraldehyde-3-phosphate dehydrogenase [Clostridia bacterium]